MKLLVNQLQEFILCLTKSNQNPIQEIFYDDIRWVCLCLSPLQHHAATFCSITLFTGMCIFPLYAIQPLSLKWSLTSSRYVYKRPYFLHSRSLLRVINCLNLMMAREGYWLFLGWYLVLPRIKALNNNTRSKNYNETNNFLTKKNTGK
jgi:hypothetical protein